MQTMHAMRLLTLLGLLFGGCVRSFAADVPNSFRGKITFFGSRAGRTSQIQTMNPDGNCLTTFLKSEAAIVCGRVSPDGHSLAYSINRRAPNDWKFGEWRATASAARLQIADSSEPGHPTARRSLATHRIESKVGTTSRLRLPPDGFAPFRFLEPTRSKIGRPMADS